MQMSFPTPKPNFMNLPPKTTQIDCIFFSRAEKNFGTTDKSTVFFSAAQRKLLEFTIKSKTVFSSAVQRKLFESRTSTATVFCSAAQQKILDCEQKSAFFSFCRAAKNFGIYQQKELINCILFWRQKDCILFSRAAKVFGIANKHCILFGRAAKNFGIATKRNSDELFLTLEETRARREIGLVETMNEKTTELGTREHRRRGEEKLDTRRYSRAHSASK
jgi:hypothetical protein